MKTLLSSFWLTLVLCVSSSYAAGPEMGAFFLATEGNWTGSGTVSIYRGQPVTFAITVQLGSVAPEPGSWTFTSTTRKPTGNPSTSVTTFQVAGDVLQVISSQYSEIAGVQTSTPVELVFSTEHADPVTGKSVFMGRGMTFLSPTTLHVISNIYENGVLVQSYDYQVEKTPPQP